MELDRKVIVITGAASGIGKALSFAAAGRGMRVVAADRNEGALAAASAELQASGAEVLAHVADVSSAADVEALAEAAYARFGEVHVLVSNAGLADAQTAWSTSIASYERMLGVNLFGAIHAARSFVPRMIAAKTQAHLVNVASAAGLFTIGGFAAYSASKYAVVGFTEALYHDLIAAGAPIGVSLVCPSWVKTPLVDHTPAARSADAQSERARQAVAQAVASGIEASDVARAILDAVEGGRFYVLTHESTKAALRVRTDDLLEGRMPSSFMRPRKQGR